MTTTTPRAGVPLLAAAQAQKHVTHNEALLEFDALICARILDRDLGTPPASPADGDAYLVKATGTGAWAGQDGNIAYSIDGGWRFYAPFAGLSAFIADELLMLVYTGSGWTDWASVLDLQNIPLLGVNTAADATNKLAVKSSALLFDNAGNGVQAKLNKHATADTASFLYQTNYSGRAEIGLTGDDDFHFKVSPDGSAWTDAIAINKTTGAASVISPTVNLGSVSQALTLHRSDAALNDAAFSIGGSGGGTLNVSVGGSTILAIASDHVVFGGIDLSIGHAEKGALTLPNAKYIGGYNAAGTDDYYIAGIDGSNKIQFGGNAGTLAIDPSTGKVGINTSSPTCRLDVNDDHLRVRTAKTPASAGASGNAGDLCWDANYVYVCVATNTWKRAALASW